MAETVDLRGVRRRRSVAIVGVVGVLLTVATLVFGGIGFITQAVANGGGVAVGLLVVARGSNDAARRMGWVLALAFLAIQVGTMAAFADWLVEQGRHDAGAWAATILGSADADFGMGLLSAAALLPILFLAVLFPDGRLAPGWRWYPWAVGAAVAAVTLGASLNPVHVGDVRLVHPLFENAVSESWTDFAEVALLAVAVLQLASIMSLVGRYRADGTSTTARQQIKWFGFGLGLYVLSIIVLLLGELTDLITSEVFIVVDGLMFTAIPLSLGVAILRYRLYDIDRIISRTLAYALTFLVLTGLFVLIATSPVLVAGGDADSFPPLLVSISTLVVAALFNPTRRRLLRSLERRFDRARYDAARVIEGFNEHVNDLTDHDAIEAGLVDVLDRTLAPATVSIWIAGRSS